MMLPSPSKLLLPIVVALQGLFLAGATAATTYSSVNPSLYDGLMGTGNGPFTVGQSFTGFSSLQSATFYIDSNTGGSTSRSYNAYLAEWDTSAGHAVAGTFSSLGSSSVVLGDYENDAPVNFSFAPVSLVSSKDYMLFFTYGSGDTSTNVDISDFGPVRDPQDPFGPLIPNPVQPDDFFSSGSAYFFNGTGYSSTAAIDTAFSSGSYSSMGANHDLRMTIQAGADAVPEPARALLVMLGLTGCFMRRRRC